MFGLASGSRPQKAMLWLSVLLYVLGGTIRTGGLVLCIGQGELQLARAAATGGCSCCAAAAACRGPAPAIAGDDCCGGARPGHTTRVDDQRESRVGPASPCDCFDLLLPLERSDSPQLGTGTSPVPMPEVGGIAEAVAVQVPQPLALEAVVGTPRPPPRASRQSLPVLRRYVVLLI
jgi:hypothetical protein